MAELKLTPEGFARSICRVWCQAAGIIPPPWDLLGLAERDAWRAVALEASVVINNHEGQSYEKASRALARTYPEAASGTDPVDRLAWETVTRFLVNLTDDDEQDDLAGLEAAWVAWANLRREHLRAV